MPSFNKVMMIGNLTRDPQLKNVSNGIVVAEFGLAMNRKYRTAAGEDKEEVCFVDCSAFGKQAETIAQWCKKGKQILVEGRLKYDTWEDKVGGAKRHKLSVVVENFQFLGSRADEMNGTGSTGGGYPGTTGSMFDQKDQGVEQKPERSHPSNPSGEQTDRAEKSERPDRRPARTGRAPARQAAEQPFGEEKMFEEADIPF